MYYETRHRFCGGVRCLAERCNPQSFRLRSYVLLQYCAGLDFRTTDHVTRFPRGNLRTRSYIDGIASRTCSVVYALNHVYWFFQCCSCSPQFMFKLTTVILTGDSFCEEYTQPANVTNPSFHSNSHLVLSQQFSGSSLLVSSTVRCRRYSQAQCFECDESNKFP